VKLIIDEHSAVHWKEFCAIDSRFWVLSWLLQMLKVATKDMWVKIFLIISVS